jgi:hypothetical protein
MTYRVDAAENSLRGRVLAAVALCAGLLSAAGCASDINEGVGPPTTVPSISGGGPKNTGTYPNLNIRPQAAAAQITPEQRAAAGAGLTASASSAQAGAAGTGMSPEEQARLKKLAEDKGAGVLAEIEGQN